MDEGTSQRVSWDDVEVHHEREGCPICFSRARHYHTQKAWRAVVDKAGEELKRRWRR
ncbi:hypothetical protein K1T35_48515 (plasmid) [Pseudonocardia sp. DSM 110487]|uniref:hypothetical protein n=1 Tax=Pseudonocardia sp. DSM 110487 TaxID=2865833 RepID=UPI001C6A5C44|nr:hypothetical protein [Pseudonocardia sp. DSM 110487]QYN41192.1 hypothetical protein K1T35_48515 [Pseudonocardia sp. DSM 110487]